MTDSTQRFSNRTVNYVKYRPSYPAAAIDLLLQTCQLSDQSLVADVGSGTGMFARLLLDRGVQVIGVEPNAAMREAGDRILAAYPHFRSLAGTADATKLPDRSVQLVTAAQAFHWFDPHPTRAEWDRILTPGGYVALLWNIRNDAASPLMAEYEAVLQRHNVDYNAVRHHRVDAEAIAAFFAPHAPQRHTFANAQLFDRDGLRGRTLSSSYAPERGQPGHEELIAALDTLWQRHERDGLVSFEYETVVYLGRLSA
jgi:SAM-dependent methyltransferase